MRAVRAKPYLHYIFSVPALLFLTLVGPLLLFGIGTQADFIIFYGAGRILRGPQRAQLYEYAVEQEVQQSFTNHPEPMVFNHPAFEALLFVPLSFFSFRAAFLIWTYFSLCVLGLSIYLLRKYIPPLGLPERLLLLMFFLYPFLDSLLQGQDSMLILLSYALAVVALKQEKQFLAGLALSLAMIKPQLVLPFLAISFLSVPRKFAMGFAAGCAALAGVSAAIVGWRATWNYPRMLLGMNTEAGRKEFHINPFVMPNLRGFASYAFDHRISPSAVAAIIALVSIAVILIEMKACRNALNEAAQSFERDLSLALLVTLVVSFHLLLHDLCLALVPVLLLLSRASGAAWDARKLFLYGSIASFFAAGVVMTSAGSSSYSLFLIPLVSLIAAVHLYRTPWFGAAKSDAYGQIFSTDRASRLPQMVQD